MRTVRTSRRHRGQGQKTSLANSGDAAGQRAKPDRSPNMDCAIHIREQPGKRGSPEMAMLQDDPTAKVFVSGLHNPDRNDSAANPARPADLLFFKSSAKGARLRLADAPCAFPCQSTIARNGGARSGRVKRLPFGKQGRAGGHGGKGSRLSWASRDEQRTHGELSARRDMVNWIGRRTGTHRRLLSRSPRGRGQGHCIRAGSPSSSNEPH